jgi:hypothetical protein
MTQMNDDTPFSRSFAPRNRRAAARRTWVALARLPAWVPVG